MDYSDFMKYAPGAGQNGGQAPSMGGMGSAPSAPSAAPQGEAPAAPIPQAAPAAAAAYSDLMKYAPQAGTFSQPKPPAGTDPSVPLDPTAHSFLQQQLPGVFGEDKNQSPDIGIMQRALVGWIRNPNDQVKYLKQQYDDAAVSDGKLVIKDKGKWFDFDPAMQWTSTLGVPRPEMSMSNLERGMNHMDGALGEYGLRAVASSQLGAMGAAQGAATGFGLAGPAGGLLGGLAGGLTGAALGGAGAEALDLGARTSMDQSIPGAHPYDLNNTVHQLLASSLFGVENYVGEKALGLVAKGVAGTARTVGSALKALVNTGPDGPGAAKYILNKLNVGGALADARLSNPAKNAAYDAIATADASKSAFAGTPQLDTLQAASGNRVMNQVYGMVRKQGAEFEALATNPAVKSAEFDATAPFQDIVQGFKQGQIVTNSGKINPTRALGDADAKAINWVMDQLPNLKGLGYDDVRAMIQSDMPNLIQSTDGNLQRQLIQLRDGLHNTLVSGLDGMKDASGRDLGQLYGQTVNKYSATSQLYNDLQKVADGPKWTTLAQKLVRENPNNAKLVINELIDSGMDPAHVVDFLQMESSRRVAQMGWFGRAKLAGIPVPMPGPKAGVGFTNGMSSGGQALGQSVDALMATRGGQAVASVAQRTVPYLAKADAWMKSLDAATRKRILADPNMLGQIDGSIASAVTGEDQAADSLLKNAGVK